MTINSPATSPRHAASQTPAPDHVAETRFFAPLRAGETHLHALEQLDRQVPPALGAFKVSCDPLDPANVRVESERLDHMRGALQSFHEASVGLAQQDVLAAVAAAKGSAEASRCGAALGAACGKVRLDAANFICAISIVAQNHVHGPMLQRQVARGRIAADEPRVVNWNAQKTAQPFYDAIAAASEGFVRDEVLEKAPAWYRWKDAQIAALLT